jgi:hypothetical protein
MAKFAIYTPSGDTIITYQGTADFPIAPDQGLGQAAKLNTTPTGVPPRTKQI